MIRADSIPANQLVPNSASFNGIRKRMLQYRDRGFYIARGTKFEKLNNILPDLRYVDENLVPIFGAPQP